MFCCCNSLNSPRSQTRGHLARSNDSSLTARSNHKLAYLLTCTTKEQILNQIWRPPIKRKGEIDVSKSKFKFSRLVGKKYNYNKSSLLCSSKLQKKKMHIARNENGQVQKQTWFNLFIFLFKNLNGASPRAGLNRGFS